MANDAKAITIIGGADGPTSIFLAGKLNTQLTIGIVVFVTAVLLLAAALILWKPGVKTKYRFVRLSIGNLLIHLMDGLITFVNTPDLAREGNPLVSRLGLGWGALFTANLIGFLLVVLTAWNFNRYEHVKIPSHSVFDYYMKLFYGENYKPIWYWYKISKNFRSNFARASYALYWGWTAGAPIFVIGWLLEMLNIRLWWWRSARIAVIVGVGVALICLYRWCREGYRLSCEDREK